MAGLLGNFKNPLASGGLLSDPMVRLQMGAAMMGGRTLGEQFGGGLQAAGVAKQAQQEAAKRNQTIEWLKTINPELAQAAEMGAIDINDAYGQVLEARKPKQPDWMNAGDGRFYSPSLDEWRSAPVDPNNPASDEYSLIPQTGVDANGNAVFLQMGKSGKAKQTELPPGVKIQKEPVKYDAGTHFILLDPITRQVIGQIPKNNEQEAFDKGYGGSRGDELGKFAGNQEATAPKDVAAADTALDVLDQIEKHPYLDRGVGGTSVFNAIPGTGGKDFQSLVDQAKGGAFLQAIQQMRGLGTLSNAEGQAATQAVTSMDTATSKEQFLSALATYRKIVEGGKARALARMPAGPLASPPPGASGGASIEELLQKY
jgi:hypothetical protein